MRSEESNEHTVMSLNSLFFSSYQNFFFPTIMLIKVKLHRSGCMKSDLHVESPVFLHYHPHLSTFILCLFPKVKLLCL